MAGIRHVNEGRPACGVLVRSDPKLRHHGLPRCPGAVASRRARERPRARSRVSTCLRHQWSEMAGFAFDETVSDLNPSRRHTWCAASSGGWQSCYWQIQPARIQNKTTRSRDSGVFLVGLENHSDGHTVATVLPKRPPKMVPVSNLRGNIPLIHPR